ncbi:hypothetical protein N234_31600 [Ralstonia pickettii DTP0602]|nr:hypothetical protein N234_31600 [Ralstonia pickettii DTP0602]
MDLGPEAKLFQVIAVVKHNLSTSAVWRVRVSHNPDFSSPIFDNALDLPPGVTPTLPYAWPVLYPIGMLEWEDDNFWSGTVSEEERLSYPSILLVVLPRITPGRYIRIDIEDEGNPDGYVELGRLFVSRAWKPQHNANAGASAGWESDTTVQRAMAGTPYFDRKPGRRVTRFNLNGMERDEAMVRVFEMQRRAGIDGEILLVWDQDDILHRLRRSYLGRQRQLSPIEQAFMNNNGTAFEIEELT